ncbi:hypothetical protein V5799_008733 [Amblyomma americanum]|uniref:Transmembrane protein 163 n=1 Tax=Amblyomma americanum TaxID=6943 RepID=A0AAQ4FCK3_AMBAM
MSDRPELVKIANQKLRGLCGHQRFFPVRQPTGGMNIAVEGRSAEKGELDAPDWITVLNKCNLEEKWARKTKLVSEEMKLIDTPPPSAKRNVKQQAEKSIASNQVKLPENGWRIIFRPKGGMVVKQYDGPTLTEAIHVSAKIEWNKACQLVKNEKQGILVFFTPSTEARDKLLRLTHLDIQGKMHEVTVHLAVPDDFSRGVIHGIGLTTSLQKIKQGIAEHEENPQVLEIRRLGQSKTIMLTFTTKEFPDIFLHHWYFLLAETTPLKLDSQLLENGPFEGGDLNRKCVLTLSIVSVVFNIVVGGTGFVFAFQRNSASIYAFAAECLLDMLSSMIVIWQYLTPHYSFARERVACILLGLFFILSAIAIISKAMDDLIVRESPTWIPVLIILAGVGAAACFLLAVVKLILAKRLGSLSLVLDGINSLISSFCAVAIIVSDLVYDSNPEVWYMDAVLSTVAALIMLLVGAKVLFENWSIGRHGHMTLQ